MNEVKASINNLSLIHLRLIKLVLQHGNASVAAKELGLTQPGISYHMKKIRQIFNDDMFMRTKYGFSPTAKCRSIEKVIQDIIVRVEDDLLNSVDFTPENIDKEIHIAVGNSVYNWMPKLVDEMYEIAPRVIICARSWTHSSFSEITSGSLNYGIYLNQDINNGLYKLELAPSIRYFFMKKDHFIAKRGYVKESDLVDFPVLLHDLCGFNSYGQSVQEKIAKTHNFDFKFKAKMTNINELIEIVENSNAILYTSALSVPVSKFEEKIAVIKAPSVFTDYEFYHTLYMSPARYGSQESDWLASFIVESFNKYAFEKYEQVSKFLI